MSKKFNYKQSKTGMMQWWWMEMLSNKFKQKRKDEGVSIRVGMREERMIKVGVTGCMAFLVTFLVMSVMAPVQTSGATGNVLMALQGTDSTISLSTSVDTVNLSMAASTDGVVRTALDTVTVTSGSAGYQLYVGMSGSSNALVRDGTDGRREADTIPASLITDINSPSTLSNNTWGFATLAQGSGTGAEDVVTNGFDSEYKVGDNSNASNKFIAVPTHGNDVIVARRSGVAEAVPTNIYYGARATSAQASGLYKGTVVYTAIGDSSAARLASVSPSRTKVVQGGQTLTVATPSTLALSSIESTEVTVGGASCTGAEAVKSDDGTGAQTNATCISPALGTGWHTVVVNFTTTSGTVESYVVNPGIEYYLDAGETNVATYMQDFTMADCVQLTTGNLVILQDKRDGNVYKVVRLADGNCWMGENLRLGNTIMSSGSIEINSLTSDYAGESFKITAENVANAADASSWTENEYDVLHIYARSNEVADANGNKYGNLYNWYTATAKSGTQGVTSGDAAASICPKGWKLPPNTGNGSYTTLFTTGTGSGGLGVVGDSGTNATFTTAVQKSPYAFSYAGLWSGGLLYVTGTQGIYWSRTAYSDSYAYNFGIISSGEYYLQNYNNKFYGRSVRCVMVASMQDFTMTACDNLTAARTVSLTDIRDRKVYNVAKLDDGLCWMTSNLRLGSTTVITLTSADTDITGTWTLPAVQTSGVTAWNSPTDAKHIYQLSNTTYGNLYNWYTATAGTGLSSMASASASNTTDAGSSICARGWRLPYGGTAVRTGSWQGLLNSAGIASNASGRTKLLGSPYSFVLAGRYAGDGYTGSYDQDTGNVYWSNSAIPLPNTNGNNIPGAFALVMDQNIVYQGAGWGYTFHGASVRCVLMNS